MARDEDTVLDARPTARNKSARIRICERALLRARNLALYLDVSDDTVARMLSARLLPKEVRISGRTVAWSRKSIDRWIALGCPSQKMAAVGVTTAQDFGRLMIAAMTDVLMGTLSPQAAAASASMGRNALKMLELQLKHGKKDDADVILKLAKVG